MKAVFSLLLVSNFFIKPVINKTQTFHGSEIEKGEAYKSKHRAIPMQIRMMTDIHWKDSCRNTEKYGIKRAGNGQEQTWRLIESQCCS